MADVEGDPKQEATEPRFVVVLHRENGEPTGHTLQTNLWLPNPWLPKAASLEEGENLLKKEDPTFLSVLNAFRRAMEIYFRSLPFTISVGPSLIRQATAAKIDEFVRKNGIKTEDEVKEHEEDEFYVMDPQHFREFIRYQGEIESAIYTSEHLPRIMIIGLVSSYDYFLSDLLRVIFARRPEMVLTEDKSIKISDLKNYSSIEDACQAEINKSIEDVIRTSHVDQIAWMESRFKIKLREGLPSFKDFIELCERRNLFTHTGGVISRQYISICKDHKIDCSALKVGDELSVDPTYYRAAVSTIYEIGAKLCYTLWHKFDVDTDAADQAINELCYDLIIQREYGVAEKILSYACGVMKTYRGPEDTRRRMVVNLANAIRLQGRDKDAKHVVDEEDWTATSINFQICVDAIRGDLQGMARKMILGGATAISAEDYRSWPVFREIRTTREFQSAFKEVFNSEVFPQKGRELAANRGEIEDTGSHTMPDRIAD